MWTHPSHPHTPILTHTLTIYDYSLLKIFKNYFRFLFCGRNWGEKRNEIDEMFSQHILISPEVQEEEQSILCHILEMPVKTNKE